MGRFWKFATVTEAISFWLVYAAFLFAKEMVSYVYRVSESGGHLTTLHGHLFNIAQFWNYFGWAIAPAIFLISLVIAAFLSALWPIFRPITGSGATGKQ